jgi:DNA-binding transcriptional MerR regulator
MEITYYNLHTVASLTNVTPERILEYCEIGLIEPYEQRDEENFFTDECIYLLRQIEFLRETRGINLEGITMILELVREIETLRAELKFQREHLPT